MVCMLPLWKDSYVYAKKKNEYSYKTTKQEDVQSMTDVHTTITHTHTHTHTHILDETMI